MPMSGKDSSERLSVLESAINEQRAQMEAHRTEDRLEHTKMREQIATLLHLRSMIWRIAMSFIALTVTQVGSGVWWAANVSAEVAHLSQVSAALTVSVRDIDHTRFPADEELNYRHDVQRSIERIEDRLISLERGRTR